MVKECLVIGRPNVGKSLFVINFAEYLGFENIEVKISFPNGFSTVNQYSIPQARQELTGLGPHKTRCLQAIHLNIPARKGYKRVKITDTTGLMDTIHQDMEIRKAIAQTLGAIRQADIIIHMIDAHNPYATSTPALLGEVDYQVAQFAQLRGRYCILANKMDLPGAREGLAQILQKLPGQYTVPISALHKRGFKEVRSFVLRSC